MTKKEYEKINQILTTLDELFSKYNSSKEDFSKNLIVVISNLQRFEKELYSSFFRAKLQYKDQIEQYNKKIRTYKENKIVNIQLLKDLINEKKDLPKPKFRENIMELIEGLNNSIQEIEYKIIVLNRKIEETNLDINEENYIIEKIEGLEEERRKKSNKMNELEQSITKELENNKYYILMNLIKVLKNREKELDKKLANLSELRNSSHKEFLAIYQKIKRYDAIKTKIQDALEKNLIFFKHYTETFIETIDAKKLLKDVVKKLKPSEDILKKTPKEIKFIIKKKKLLKKLKEERTKKALEKKRTGKKLDFYELKLILDQLEKEK